MAPESPRGQRRNAQPKPPRSEYKSSSLTVLNVQSWVGPEYGNPDTPPWHWPPLITDQITDQYAPYCSELRYAVSNKYIELADHWWIQQDLNTLRLRHLPKYAILSKKIRAFRHVTE